MTTKENLTQYGCDFCKKKLFAKHAMIKHEDNCLNNPKNKRPCLSCKHMDRATIEVEFKRWGSPEYGEDYSMQEKEVFKCNLYDKLMFPFSIERKDLHNKYPDTYQDQEPMPKECDGYIELYSDII
jgi:hypothetical protein